MFDAETLKPNVRYHVLALLAEHLGEGRRKQLVETEVTLAGDATDVFFAQGFLTRAGNATRVLLLVNKGNASAAVTVPGAAGKRASWVDARAGYSAVPLGSGVVPSSGTVTLGGFAVELVWM